MQLCLRGRVSAATLFVAGTLALSPLTSVWAQTSQPAVDATDEQLSAWHENLRNYAPLEDGCFHVSYPSVQWEKVACGPKPAIRSSTKAKAMAAAAAMAHTAQFPLAVAGNGNDYVAQTAGITRSSHGSFPITRNINSESSVPNPEYGNDGIFGKNKYSLQLNTNVSASSVPCSAFGYKECYVWEQFIYTVGGSGYVTAVFIQNWLFPSPTDYKRLGCPAGWEDASSLGYAACVVNSNGVLAPSVPATELGNVKLSGSVSSGRNTVIFSYDGEAYSDSELDSTVHLSAWWRQSEFNVVGDAGGAEAVFNKGVDLKVKLVVKDGSTNAPTCVADAGTTGESNNLNLGPCNTVSGPSPAITFNETN